MYKRGYRTGYLQATANQSVRFGRPALRSIYHKHLGRRGFVIGNGPSLQIPDLSRLKNEVTIASNKIYLAFPHTDWRPTYTTVCDNLVWDKIHNTAHEHYTTIYHPSYLDTSASEVECVAYKNLGNASLLGCDYRPVAFSGDLTAGAYAGNTVTYDNLQLAVHLGLNPIYLIGCDHYYQGEQGIRPGKPVPSVATNHFSPEYRMRGERVNPAPIELMTEAYRVAQTYAEQTETEIVNATRGGFLDIFPRTSFDEIFGT